MRRLPWLLLCCLVLPLGTRAAPPEKEASLDPQVERKLVDLEGQVTALESKLHELNQRIRSINEKVFYKNYSGPRVRLLHLNKLGGAFRITRAVFWLDKKKIIDRSATKRRPLPKKIKLFEGALKAGTHSLRAKVFVKGHGYGVFTYLKKYGFELKNRTNFQSMSGRLVTVQIETLYGSGSSFKERLKIHFRINTKMITKRSSPPPPRKR